MNQELCRKQWLDATEQCAELTGRSDEVQRDNEALQTKLKHARLVHWLLSQWSFNDYRKIDAGIFNDYRFRFSILDY